jgi:restriction system protein
VVDQVFSWAVALLLLVAAVWVLARIGAAYSEAGGTPEGFSEDRAFSAEAVAAIRSLVDLLPQLEQWKNRLPASSPTSAAAARDELDVQLQELEVIAKRLGGAHRAKGGTDNRKFAVKWQSWKRWQWVRLQVLRARVATYSAKKVVQRGLLNVADPATSETVLSGLLHRDSAGWVRIVGTTAVIERSAPKDRVPRSVKVERVVDGKKRRHDTPRPTRDVNRDYVDVICADARSFISKAFGKVPGLTTIELSLWRYTLDPRRGIDVRECVLTISVDRLTWSGIVHRKVTAENALRNFPLQLDYDNAYRLRSVPGPRQALSKPTRSIANADLLHIDPVDFEVLVSRLMAALGFVVRLTKRSGDGGVDIDAENTNPILGGRVLVQCKRYQGSVGAPVVRDLYGAVTHARAMKGILITTSFFTAEAAKFAEGQPIELIDGRELQRLLQEHGLLAEPDQDQMTPATAI